MYARAIAAGHAWRVELDDLTLRLLRSLDTAYAEAVDALRQVLATPADWQTAWTVFSSTLAHAVGLRLGRYLRAVRALSRQTIDRTVTDREAVQLLGAMTSRRPIREQLEIQEPLEQILRRAVDLEVERPITPAQARRLIKQTLYPPLEPREIARILGSSVTFAARLSSAIWSESDKSRLRSSIISGMAQGKNIDEMVRANAPDFAAERWKLRRVIRTEAVRIAQQDARQREEDLLGDVTAGMVIQAVLDNRTRPEHRRRHGTVYHRQRDGTYRDARGNLAPVLPDAPNCRCYYVRIYRTDLDLPGIETPTGVLPDRDTYQSIWQQSSPAQRRRLVGAANYRAAQERLGREPTAADFLDPVSGEMIDFSTI